MAMSRREFLEVSGGAAGALFTGCARPGGTSVTVPGPRALPAGPADLILRNGTVLTVDATDRVAEAVAVAKGVIQKVGTDEEVLVLRGPTTEVIDVGRRAVTPGIIDAHNHMMYFGHQRRFLVDIRPPRVRTKADLLRVVREAAGGTREGDWILGCQGFPMVMEDSPTRRELDDATPAHPVFMPHSSGQYGVANSLALRIAGITTDTPHPYGGRIEKDPKSGEPTGRLVQYPAMDLVRGRAPRPTTAQYEEAVRHAAGLFLPWGITSVQDVIVYLRQHTRIYEDMASRRALPVRLYVLEYIDSLRKAREMTARHHHYHDPLYTFGGWKLAIDGAPAGGTTLMYDRSQPGSRRAFPLHRPREFNEMVKILHDSGFQVSVHTVGDEGMDLCLDAFEKAYTSPGDTGRRHRFEHANYPTAKNLDRMQKLGIVASVQPSWIHLYGDGYERMLGGEIARRTIPVRSFLGRGIPVAFSSDVPATMVFEPYWAFIGAVTRRTRAGRTLAPEEAIGMKEALRAHTYTAAWAAFEDQVKGSLEPGKFADLAVWEQNPYTVRPDPAAMKELRVTMTVLDGKVVYRASS